MSQNKKAISNLIAYVLLISMILTLALLLYGWLKTQIPKPLPECPEGVTLSITNYSCSSNSLKLEIVNKGRFNASYLIKASNETEDAKIGLYTLSTDSNPFNPLNIGEIEPNKRKSETYTKYNGNNFISDLNITLIEIQPIVYSDEGPVLCPNYVSLKIDNCDLS